MYKNRPNVLSIAGFDPSAGAGVLADVKTFETLKVYGFAIVSALTNQDDTTVFNVDWVDLTKVKAQIRTLFNKFTITACKIGIIKNLDELEEIIDCLKYYNPSIKIVVDPVIKSTSGFVFQQVNHQKKWGDILKKISLLTPNYNEFEMFLGTSFFDDFIKDFASYGDFLLKGGHNKTQKGTDILFCNQQQLLIKPFSSNVYEKHGSGCVLSSAITSFLALGNDVYSSCFQAKKYTEFFLNSNNSLLGYHQI